MNTLWVYWDCDKRDCGKENFRTIERGTTITDDKCDHCSRFIYEPRWFEIDHSKDTDLLERFKQQQDDKRE